MTRITIPRKPLLDALAFLKGCTGKPYEDRLYIQPRLKRLSGRAFSSTGEILFGDEFQTEEEDLMPQIFSLDLRLFCKIVKSQKGQSVSISIEGDAGGKGLLWVNESFQQIPFFLDEEAPCVPEKGADLGVFDAGKIRPLGELRVDAEKRPYTEFILFEDGMAISTDCVRLYTLKVETMGQFFISKTAALAAGTQVGKAMVSGAGEEIVISGTGDGYIWGLSEMAEQVMFPPMSGLLSPAAYQEAFDVEKNAISKALSAAVVIEKYWVDLDFRQGHLGIFSSSDEKGVFSEEIPHTLKGHLADVYARFCPMKMLHFLKNTTQATCSVFPPKSENQPIRLDAGEFSCVLMGMRV